MIMEQPAVLESQGITKYFYSPEKTKVLKWGNQGAESPLCYIYFRRWIRITKANC